MHMHTRSHTHEHVCTCVPAPMCVHTCTHTCMPAHTHTHMHPVKCRCDSPGHSGPETSCREGRTSAPTPPQPSGGPQRCQPSSASKTSGMCTTMSRGDTGTSLSQESSTSSPLSPGQGRQLKPGLLKMDQHDLSPTPAPQDRRLCSDTLTVLPQSESRTVCPPYLRAPCLLTLLVFETFGPPGPQMDTSGHSWTPQSGSDLGLWTHLP